MERGRRTAGICYSNRQPSKATSSLSQIVGNVSMKIASPFAGGSITIVTTIPFEIRATPVTAVLEYVCQQCNEPRIHRHIREARPLVHRVRRGDSRREHPRPHDDGGERESQGSTSANPRREPSLETTHRRGPYQARTHYNRN